MSFTGIEFALFLPLVLMIHWLLPRRTAAQNAFVLFASYVFYASWDPRLLVLLLVSTAVDYFTTLYIARNLPAEGSEATPEGRAARRRARGALLVSLAYNLGQLGFFKYAGFFADSLNGLFQAVGLPSSLPVLRLALPLGLSFYTLQKLAYVIDVYYGRLEPCRSPLTFATFVAFFPQLIAGPIPRGGELIPQLSAPRTLDPDRVAAGAGAFFLGFVKKAYVADYLARFVVDPVFADPAGYSRASHWVALMGYAVQVFCDFSGYSDMALGCGRLLGVELPQNFNYPFLSRSVMELWRRWHITLNTWLFEYVYGPLTTGGSWFRGRLDLAFLVVFLASGLWHGARWTFVLWGALHGLALVVHRRWDEHYRGLCRRDRSYVALRKGTRYQTAAWALTQSFFLLTLVPFRAPSLEAAGTFARGLVAGQGASLPLVSTNILACVVFFVGYHLLELFRGGALRERFFALPAPVRGIAYGLVVVYLLLYVPVATGTFIYAQF